MNEYKRNIDELVSLITAWEGTEKSCELILDSEVAYDVARELYYELDKYFLIEETDQFERLLKENDILGVILIAHCDGSVEYMLQRVMNDKGETYFDDLTEVLYIQDSLIDCIDLKEFTNADIFMLKDFNEEDDVEECTCKCCSCCDECDEKDEDLFQVLADELLVSIGEYATDNKELTYEMICDKLAEAYELGRDDMQEEIQEMVNNIRF